MLTLQTASVLSAWCSAPLYGINCLLAVLCAYAVTRKGKGSTWALALVIVVQWILCTGHFASLFAQVVRGFIDPPRLPSPGSPALAIIRAFLGNETTKTTAYFLNQSSPEHTAEVAFYVFNSLITDCFMTWRVFVVWDRKVWLATPFMILNVITLVFGALVVQNNTQVGFDLPKYFTGSGRQRVLTMWAASVVTQTAGTVLIAYRELSTPIWVPSMRTHRYFTPLSTLCAVVDSGATYTLGIILTLVFYIQQRSEGAIVAAILGQIATTVPLSIIVREWCKTMKSGFKHAPLHPRSALLENRRDIERRGAIQLPSETLRATEGVNVSVVKATHGDVHPLTLHQLASDEALKNAQLGSYTSL